MGACAGTDEGGFAWLTLNYLLGHLGQGEGDTVAAIDLVGAHASRGYACQPSNEHCLMLGGTGNTQQLCCSALQPTELGFPDHDQRR